LRLGHARGQLWAARGLARPPARRRFQHAARRPGAARAAADDAGGMHGGVRPDAADQRHRLARPLAPVLLLRVGRRRHPAGPGGSLYAAEPEQLTTDGKLKLAPVFVSRQEIVFSVHESPNLVALKRLKVKDRTQERLHPAVTAHQFDPAYSADGRYHCYAMSA